MFKCKLCGSETEKSIVSDRYRCSNPSCNMFNVWLTESEWNKLNATWIPVEERLPEKNGWYWVKTKLDDNKIGHSSAYFNADSTGKYFGNINMDYIISWMEIEE